MNLSKENKHEKCNYSCNYNLNRQPFFRLSKTVPNKRVVETVVNAFKLEFEKDQKRYNCYVRGFDYDESSNSITCLQGTADKEKYAADARRIRDDVTIKFIGVIDNNYEQFINDLQNRRATTNFLGDITELSLGTAIGITNGQRALQILGVALTAFRGGRKSVDQSFYERQSTPILITKMDTSRDRIMTAILVKRGKFGVDKYTLEDSLGDVIKYFWAGTLTRGFVELSKDASVQARNAENQLSVIEGVPINPIPSATQQQFSDNIAAQRISLAKQFRDAETITDPDKKAEAVKKILAKYETIWTDITVKDEFKAIVTELKAVPEYNATISKIGDSANPPKRVELDKLIAKFMERIAEEDNKAENTKLREIFLNTLQKANQ